MLDRAPLVDLLRVMVLIREFEDEVQRLFLKGMIHGTTHLARGQEAVSAGVMRALRLQDRVTVTYRGHGHCLARGMSMDGMFAELLGRATGVCRGRGGSMHLKDFEKGIIGSFAIVGAGLPVAVGAAFSAKLQGEDRVCVSFFGDGATNIGTFHESLNLAAVHKLPVVFVCENNLYGEYTRIDRTTPFEDIARRAAAYAIPGEAVDGNDVLAVYEAASAAVARARRGDGPTLLECKTYRHGGHSRSDPAKYRPEDEVRAWLAKDPIDRFRMYLEAHGILDQAGSDRILAEVREAVRAASTAATAGPWPDVSELATGVYA
jgi:pyruvate dehydrogenase E1 component alpha subunit